MALPVTIGDRFRAAWKAFNQNYKPDPEAFQKFMAARKAKQDAALDKLDGFDKALVRSIAAGTSNWEQLLPQVMPAIERLDTADQLNIVLYVTKGNPSSVLTGPMRQWLAKRENVGALVQYRGENEDTVIVVTE